MSADPVTLETLKLLVQVAWSDHVVVPAEVDYVISLAQNAGVSAMEIAHLRECLRDDCALLAPDMDLLRSHRDDVLRVCSELIAIDDEIVDDEVATLAAIEDMLADDAP